MCQHATYINMPSDKTSKIQVVKTVAGCVVAHHAGPAFARDAVVSTNRHNDEPSSVADWSYTPCLMLAATTLKHIGRLVF